MIMYGEESDELSIIGAVGMASLTVRPLDTGIAQGFSDLPVLGSTATLSVIESACSAAIAEHLGSSESSFTVGVAIQIRGTVSVGSEVRALVRAVELDGEILLFECEVHQDQRTIAVAQLQRRLVDRLSFMARSAAENLRKGSVAM
jgi:predicted thioesterase